MNIKYKEDIIWYLQETHFNFKDKCKIKSRGRETGALYRGN